jgi:hypothetical protein
MDDAISTMLLVVSLIGVCGVFYLISQSPTPPKPAPPKYMRPPWYDDPVWRAKEQARIEHDNAARLAAERRYVQGLFALLPVGSAKDRERDLARGPRTIAEPSGSLDDVTDAYLNWFRAHGHGCRSQGVVAGEFICDSQTTVNTQTSFHVQRRDDDSFSWRVLTSID